MVNNETTTSTSVLVAEDDRVISDVIRFNLERARYQVTIARNGTEAWSLLQTRRFDVLVTDYQMPGMTGEEVCRAFRQAYPEVQLPIIFLSARGLELDVAKMQAELGVETLMYKPFSPRELVDEIARCAKKSIALL